MRLGSRTSPIRTARSKPSATRSTLRFARLSSTSTAGWSSLKRARSGRTRLCPKVVGALSREVQPAGEGELHGDVAGIVAKLAVAGPLQLRVEGQFGRQLAEILELCEGGLKQCGEGFFHEGA